ncbi:hypothetical protein [Bacillus cereus]|uniref:hypothetical protein n=1 Tax=Bacillus cereus TaxID=1396 RepID=UPI003EE23EF8
MESITKIIADFENRINDLQRDNEGLIQTLNCVSASVEGLSQKVSTLEKGLAMKADITHVREMVKESVGMNCEVGVSLDGRVVAKSIVEHTANSIQGRLIKGSELNETR